MPTHCEEDKKTKEAYCQWGYKSGKKYEYILGSVRSKLIAKSKADRQGRAIKANQYGGTNKKRSSRNSKRRTSRKQKSNKKRTSRIKRHSRRRISRRKTK